MRRPGRRARRPVEAPNPPSGHARGRIAKAMADTFTAHPESPGMRTIIVVSDGTYVTETCYGYADGVDAATVMMSCAEGFLRAEGRNVKVLSIKVPASSDQPEDGERTHE